MVKILHLVENVAIGAAIYGLIIYLYNFKLALENHSPSLKFIVVKVALFLSVWQRIILNVLHVDKWLVLDKYVTSKHILGSIDYIDNLLVTIEMLILSIAVSYTFSYEEFSKEEDTPNVVMNMIAVTKIL